MAEAHLWLRLREVFRAWMIQRAGSVAMWRGFRAQMEDYGCPGSWA